MMGWELRKGKSSLTFQQKKYIHSTHFLTFHKLKTKIE